jgi:hypothetical protein
VAVANLVAVSIQDLRPNPQDRSTFYLQNIYQLLADPNSPNVSIPHTLTDPPRFSPPRHAVWANSLWFLSLAVGLTCGLLATLLGQWARRYLRLTQTRSSPHKQARIRAFFAEGVDKFHLPWVVEALRFLLHLSLSLFFAGLLVLLFNTDHIVFGVVAGWVGLCVAVYGYITFIPIFRQDSPYCSPLSSLAWSLLNGTIYAAIWTLDFFRVPERVGFAICDRMLDLGMFSYRCLVEGMDKTAKETALKTSSEIDARALMWTFDPLDEDDKLERFFAGIPGFCSSKAVSNPFGFLIDPYKWRLSNALIGLMHRTLTSNSVSESVRRRRSLICRRAMHALSLSIDPSICEDIINGGWNGILNHVDFGHFVKRDHYNDPSAAYYSTCMVAIVIARVRERDGLWLELATGHLGLSAPVLQSYLVHGDSVLLANFIQILRDIVRVHFEHFWSGDAATRWKVVESVSRFDIQDTLPTLQHDFCDLWNEILHMARTTPDHHTRSILIVLLKNVRRAYIALHEGTDSSPTAFSTSTTDDEDVLFLLSSYPRCNIPGHLPRAALHVRDAFIDAASRTYTSAPQPIVLPAASAPKLSQINFDGHELPPIMVPTLDSAPASPAQGPADASIITSTSSLVPIAQSTQTVTTTLTSLAHSSSPSAPPTPANHA